MDPWFIHCHIPHKKILFIALKQRSESSTRCCFWLTVSKRGTHFEQRFLMLKYSFKMVNTLPSDIFKVSAISRNFNLRSVKTILWTFFMFSGTTAKLGRPKRSASSVFFTAAFKISKPLLYHLSRWSRVWMTLVKPLLCLECIFLLKDNALSTYEIQIFPLFWKLWK